MFGVRDNETFTITDIDSFLRNNMKVDKIYLSEAEWKGMGLPDGGSSLYKGVTLIKTDQVMGPAIPYPYF